MGDSWAFLVAGGGLTLVASTATSWVQGAIQRRGVREDRVWERRAELYVDMLGAAEINLREGRVRAFASTHVRDLYEAMATARTALVAHANRYQASEGGDQWEVELHRLIREVTGANTSLEKQIRAELRIGGNLPKKRWWPPTRAGAD